VAARVRDGDQDTSRRWVRLSLALAVIALCIGGGSVAYASKSDHRSYVTAAVTKGSVQQLLDLTGSVARVHQANASFAVSGTVASVSVKVGDIVQAGQELARLDPTSLRAAVLDATATLAQAKATLSSDEAASSSTPTNRSTSTPSASTGNSSTGSPSTGGRGAAASGLAANISRTRATVTAAQLRVTADATALDRVLAAAATACVNRVTTGTASPSVTASSTAGGRGAVRRMRSPSPHRSPSPSPSPSTSSSASSSVECAAALAAAQAASSHVAADQRALAEVTKQLGSVAAQAAASGLTSNARTGETPSTSTSTSAGRNGTSRTAAAMSAGTSGAAGSANRVFSDKAAVVAAQTVLDDAERNLRGAVLTAPIGGTVASVGVVKGGAASTSDAVTIVGSGAARVTVDVPLNSIRNVTVGQQALVTPDGALSAVAGSVESVSLLPASSTNATTSYPVVVLVPRSDQGLASGSRAQVSLVLRTVTGVLTVPNSALTMTGTGAAIVTSVKGSVLTRTIVRTGAVGTFATEVTSGIRAGQTVLLADRNRPLPTNSSTSTRRFVGGGGTGGFGGSSTGGGGFGLSGPGG
jgi:multidrug efflux pump subunit AcrA (membrane-fusion protein)